MVMKILYFKEPLNTEAVKKIINNWQKTQDRQFFSGDPLFLNMYYSYADIVKN